MKSTGSSHRPSPRQSDWGPVPYYVSYSSVVQKIPEDERSNNIRDKTDWGASA